VRKFEKTGSSREQRYTSSISDLSDCICTRMYLCIVLLFVPVSFSLFISSIDAHIVISYIDILCSIGSSLCVAHALFLNINKGPGFAVEVLAKHHVRPASIGLNRADGFWVFIL